MCEHFSNLNDCVRLAEVLKLSEKYQSEIRDTYVLSRCFSTLALQILWKWSEEKEVDATGEVLHRALIQFGWTRLAGDLEADLLGAK